MYKPEGPRLRKHLSAVLNFAMFREEKLAAYTALQEKLEGLLQEKEAAAARRAEKKVMVRTLKGRLGSARGKRSGGPLAGPRHETDYFARKIA